VSRLRICYLDGETQEFDSPVPRYPKVAEMLPPADAAWIGLEALRISAGLVPFMLLISAVG
jgi:hypothetical protein